MARMMGAARPGHRGVCRYAARGCRCYLYPGEYGRRAKITRRRRNRALESRTWRRAAEAEAAAAAVR